MSKQQEDRGARLGGRAEGKGRRTGGCPRGARSRGGGAGQGRCIQSGGGGPRRGREGAEPGRGGGARSSRPQPSRGPRTLWPQGAAERRRARPARRRTCRADLLSDPSPRAPPAAMNHSPLKTALAHECFSDQDNSTLALPSDQKMKTGTSGRQRVQEQVMMTVKRQKSKSSQASTLSHSNRGGCSAPACSARVGLNRAAGTGGGARPGAATRPGSAGPRQGSGRLEPWSATGPRDPRASGCEGGPLRGHSQRGGTPRTSRSRSQARALGRAGSLFPILFKGTDAPTPSCPAPGPQGSLRCLPLPPPPDRSLASRPRALSR